MGVLACGQSETCDQVGPQVEYPIRPRDLFVAVGQPGGQLADAFRVIPGTDIIGLSPEHWIQYCYTPRIADPTNYTWVGWIDSAYSEPPDGGVDPGLADPRNTYCADFQDAGCAPQPGQPHGKVVLQMRNHQNNIVIIPLNP